jgi:hypothetical protein
MIIFTPVLRVGPEIPGGKLLGGVRVYAAAGPIDRMSPDIVESKHM